MLYIFDWDGTLCDSTKTIISAMQIAAKECDLRPLQANEVKNIIGLGLPEAIEYLYPNEALASRGNLKQAYSKYFLEIDVENPSVFYPKVQETLEYLKSANHKLAIATGKSRRGLNRILKNMGLENYFHATRCADETTSKPHPQMLEELLAHFNMPVKHSVMLGDTEYDMEMAQRIGMRRIAVSYGAHSVERLMAFEPVACMDCFSELLELH